MDHKKSIPFYAKNLFLVIKDLDNFPFRPYSQKRQKLNSNLKMNFQSLLWSLNGLHYCREILWATRYECHLLLLEWSPYLNVVMESFTISFIILFAKWNLIIFWR